MGTKEGFEEGKFVGKEDGELGIREGLADG